jgi:hypothetical protein
MSRTHEQNLACIQANLANFRGYTRTNPTGWNRGQVAALEQAESDYKRLMAGEIQHRDMCHTARELTMNMPDWGTHGT